MAPGPAHALQAEVPGKSRHEGYKIGVRLIASSLDSIEMFPPKIQSLSSPQHTSAAAKGR